MQSQIDLTFLGKLFVWASAIVAGGFALFRFLAEHRLKKKEFKLKADEKHLSQSADLEKTKLEIGFKFHEHTQSELWKMLEDKDADLDELKTEIQKYLENERLTAHLYLVIMRGLGDLKIDLALLEVHHIQRGSNTRHCEQITAQIGKIRARIKELEEILP